MRSQHKNAAYAKKSEAATQQTNRSFMQAAAKINGRSHILRTKSLVLQSYQVPMRKEYMQVTYALTTMRNI